MNSNATDEISFTHHALARIRQRGVQADALSLVLAEADERHHVGRGAVAERISRAKRKWLRQSGTPGALLDVARELVVVFAVDGAVMTVISHPGQKGRVYLGADRTRLRYRVTRKYQ